MTLRQLATAGKTVDLAHLDGQLPEELHRLLEYAILASKRDPFDPMERALIEAGDRLIRATEHLHPLWSLTREYPLPPGLLAVSHAWRTGNNDDDVVLATKGAPEAIADLCHLNPDQRASLARAVTSLASQGLRVLGVAQGTTRQGALPADPHELSLELVGLLGFEDPLRPTVPGAMAECQAAGVRVVMITGDYPATAESNRRGSRGRRPGSARRRLLLDRRGHSSRPTHLRQHQKGHRLRRAPRVLLQRDPHQIGRRLQLRIAHLCLPRNGQRNP